MDKKITDIKNKSLTYGRGYVYSIQYHLVWCTKYRKKILTGKIERSLKDYLQKIADAYSFDITALEVMPDHVHMLIDCRPQFHPSDMIKIIKGNTARWLFMEYPELKNQLWKGHLWNPSYCIVTVSDRSLEKVEQYIKTQKER